MPDDKSKAKVAISYSWTSDEHRKWVHSLATQLMSDGIDVVLDQWSLEEGQDVNKFMERLVADASIHRVLILSDKLYADKADARKGGVGVEAQIISETVYKSVDQEKFIPIVCERDENGEACLPIYLKSRVYIDFSDESSHSEAYERLIRNIFGRPETPKPSLGAPPAHIFDDDAIVVKSTQKCKRFRDFVASGKGNLSLAFEDFQDEFCHDFEGLRLPYERELHDQWCDLLAGNVNRARTHRDVFVDFINTGARHVRGDWYMNGVFALLEKLLLFPFRPASEGSSFSWSEDNYKFLVYELFLYTCAALIKAARYEDARSLFEHRYAAVDQFGALELYGFGTFNKRADSIEELCGEKDGRLHYSLMADWIHERAARKDLPFREILQAEVICWLAGLNLRSDWYPRCLIYSQRIGKLELFARAIDKRESLLWQLCWASTMAKK